ncbi:MAG: nucleotidyltransferase domain-containing protein [Pyrinomonadaceae bacterium]|nr:nucleotidyltransferase domain-containing protein [Pyrinomonadaceae bacterium]MCX7640902.1 nucleotidyltransferase domain-containing protein [Pyrinomonadaceae bacterium]MDW8305371.1 nucleotidyltransferase domain-containing protein [Acidobacteriota bacterium]
MLEKEEFGSKELEMFVEDLKSTHGKNLAAVILYGSATTGEFKRGVSDYDLIIALHKITPEDLLLAHAAVREWQKLGHRPPAYFTVSELITSSDVFPIELYQMKKSRVVLFGDDILADVEVSDKNLRHQIEYELRGKLIRLRKLYVSAYGSAERLSELMVRSVSSFITLLRASLILLGIDPPVKKRDVVEIASKHLQINKEPFLKILEMRDREKEYDDVLLNQLFAAYMKEIESFVMQIDKMD